MDNLLQYMISFVMRGEEKMEGDIFSFEMPHFTVMASKTPKTCITLLVGSPKVLFSRLMDTGNSFPP